MKPRALTLAAALLVAACVGTSDDAAESTTSRPPTTTAASSAPESIATTTTTTTTSLPAPPTPAPIAWSACDDAQCGTLSVPVDYADPTGATLELALLRRPATGDRVGALFFNFGGPGAGARSLTRRWPVPSSIRERFDIIGMDPRGVGASSPLACGIEPSLLYSVDPTMEDQADRDLLVDVSRQYVADCEKRLDLLPHLGTRNVARDMDQVRAALGDEQLSFIGYSYGTSIGQTYASLFPHRVRSMILDGVVDTAPSGIEAAKRQAEGFEVALANWASGCAVRDSCRLDDPVAAIDQVIAAAEAGIPSTQGVRSLGPGEASLGIVLPLYNEARWSALDDAVAGALAGDGRLLVGLADTYLGIVDFSIYFAVNCLDSAWPRDTDAFFAEGKVIAATSPRHGEAIVLDYIRCALWPVDPDPLGALTAPGTAPVLVVSGTGDFATPYENGVIVAERLGNAHLLTFDGEGHTITFQGNGCVDAVAVAYLLDGTVPAPEASCTG